MSPRSDILRGWARWRWLTEQRRKGRLLEPSIRVQGNLEALDIRLSLGKRCHLDTGCILWLGEREGQIELGEDVYIGPNSFLGTNTHKLSIGDKSMIGAQCYLITENHGRKEEKLAYREQGFVGRDVVIGRNVWLGAQVVVLPGIKIGDNAVVGAGAVVTRHIPHGETWAGVPARALPNIKRKTGE